jgi:8-oxo-dGTP pyrophosphatase MutT (NUDIX family)
MKLKSMLEAYVPFNEQERTDKEMMLSLLDEASLHRTQLFAHWTSSAIVVNEAMDKVLFAFHNIYQSWSWVGGHNDGDGDPLFVAMKEASEETGVTALRPATEDIFMIDVIYVPHHIKKGRYVSDHLHLNTAFLILADEQAPLFVKEDENSGVRWFLLEDVFAHISEARMVPVYQKAFDKIKALKHHPI